MRKRVLYYQMYQYLDREETDANKLKIVEERKREVFGQEYDSFMNTLVRQLNDKLWDEITLITDEQVTTDNFFDVYAKYFSGGVISWILHAY